MTIEYANIFQPPLPQGNLSYIWENLYGSSIGLALTSTIAQSDHPILIVVPDSLIASLLMEEFHFFDHSEHRIMLFPDWETLPYDYFSPHQDIISERLATLSQLTTFRKGAIVTTISTLMHRLAPREYLDGQGFFLKIGDQLNIDILRTRLTKANYRSVGQVREHGEFAVRGSIVDLFPMGSKQPFRIDLLDNEVDTIRIFSTDSQRSTDKVDEIHLLPGREFPLTEESIERFRQNWRSQFTGNPLKNPIYQDISEGICSPGIEYYLSLFFDKTATLFDYLPEDICIVTINNIVEKSKEFWQEVSTRYDQGRFNTARPLLSPDKVFVSATSVNESLEKFANIQISDSHHEKATLLRSKRRPVSFATTPTPALNINHKEAQPFAALQQFIANDAGRILFCVETIGRREIILQLFKNISLHPTYFHSWQTFLTNSERLGIIVAPLQEGFKLHHPEITLITEAQLYGERVLQRRLRKKNHQDPDKLIQNLTELQIGDPVVHIDHGIGRYLGLQTLSIKDQVTEFFCLEYQNADKLYVPVALLHLISRYSGTNPDHIPMSKLGSEQWQKSKRKATENVRDIAAELLDLYAKRAARSGHAATFVADQYKIFASQFPFEETPDQLQAIDQVFADMMSEKPMDRVICGDVGFGKTEVALRAAFLAVQNSQQIVVLVPTTLLAQQHFQTFQDRFADWPVTIEMLSRFRTSKEQKSTMQRMEQGQVDIVIGTHKLLQTDIKLKSLGLVIIDEEHRFGVQQKEKLKALRTSVDILSLTATPIPRTLNMALSGIRDLSIIATPPAKRLSVKTFVHEYEDHLIQEAIQREIFRGGQVYFLHNEVLTINKKAEEISGLAREARVGIAHGQMHERELERVMAEFYHRHYNVLVCSTIIESGIDIPTANTIIINRADKFGLAQLHQLRGRVGRSHHQAYAYLLIPSKQYITTDAKKRLDVIASLDTLGVGFTLATHDLEIRGAGELLGESQSGNIQEIGFTFYMDLLSRAVELLKSGKEVDWQKALLPHHSEIDLHLPALIPEIYLGDIQLRLQFYKRIANAKNETELDEIQVEMIDRFGLLPHPLKNLFALRSLKHYADQLGIVKIDANEQGGRIEFSEKPNIKPENIIKLIQAYPTVYRFDGPRGLRFALDKHEISERIHLIEKILSQF
ncbi:MAG: transcription-repair coupling factor [Gammaproteobacteria bacterium RIFCSPHIGHO2_12_FULL_37_14]|nr:MAG: transcription-repair coupling factor [Gammaproteobacteria bacterium RIFCSPHIGHO2_12_FULL_37_14]